MPNYNFTLSSLLSVIIIYYAALHKHHITHCTTPSVCLVHTCNSTTEGRRKLKFGTQYLHDNRNGHAISQRKVKRSTSLEFTKFRHEIRYNKQRNDRTILKLDGIIPHKLPYTEDLFTKWKCQKPKSRDQHIGTAYIAFRLTAPERKNLQSSN